MNIVRIIKKIETLTYKKYTEDILNEAFGK